MSTFSKYFLICTLLSAISCNQNKQEAISDTPTFFLNSYLSNLQKYNSADFMSFSDLYLLNIDSFRRNSLLQLDLNLYDSLEYYRSCLLKLEDSLYSDNRFYIDFTYMNNGFNGINKFNFSYLDFENDKMYVINNQGGCLGGIDTIDLKNNSRADVFDQFAKYWIVKSMNEYDFAHPSHGVKGVVAFQSTFAGKTHKYSFTFEDGEGSFLPEFLTDMDGFKKE